MKRLAVICSYYAPHMGGIASQVEAVAQQHARFGLEVHIVTRCWHDAAPYEQAGSLHVHRIEGSERRITNSPAFIWRAAQTVRSVRPDVIHAHELLLPTSAALVANQLAGAPVVVTVHSSGVELGECARLARARLGAQRLALLRRKVAAFVAVSQAVEQDMAAVSIPPAKRFIVPNGIDMDRHRPLARGARLALRQRLGLPEGKLVVYTGRLSSEKRVVEVATMWPSLRAVHPDAWLVLVGDGPLINAVHGMENVGVLALGAKPNVADYLAAADLFVMPSASEGFSISTLEALACGLPVVATRVGAIPELVDAEAGCVVAVDDYAAMWDALSALLGAPERWAQMGAAGRAAVVENYALPTVARRLLTIYNQVA